MRSYTYANRMRLKGDRILRSLLLPVLTASMVVTGTHSTYAYTAVKGTVTCTSGKVRKEASTDASFAFGVRKDDEVTIVDEQKGSDGKLWYKVQIGGSTGFIRSDLVAKSKTKADNSKAADSKKNASGNNDSATGAILVDRAIVREQPSTKAEITMCLTKDAGVKITGAVNGEDGKKWYAVLYTKGDLAYKGYLRSDLLKASKDVAVSQVQQDQASKTEQTDTQKQDDSGGDSKASEGVQIGKIKGTGINVRKAAVDGEVLCRVTQGQTVTVTEQLAGSDGNVWYKISFINNLTPQTGYIRSDYVEGVTRTVVAQEATAPGDSVYVLGERRSDEDFEASIEKFPEDYKPGLRALHEKYPNWSFEAVETGLDWNSSVEAESSVGKNLVAMSSIASWKSKAPQAYNPESNTWYGFDGGTWASASPELIAHYMDPRNFLNEEGIFQFETVDCQDYQNEEGVSRIVADTFINSSFTDTDGTERRYVDVIMEAGREAGVSPYHIASRMIQEQGLYGRSQSISGTLSGHEGYFNYFNIGSYAANGRLPVENGLIYAAQEDEEFCRPWNSRYRSIMGSAKYIAQKYVKKGQNTLYFEKFNVVNKENTIYSHQYMSNVLAAAKESERMRKAYTDTDSTLVFRIPYYYNMPDAPCVKPTDEAPAAEAEQEQPEQEQEQTQDQEEQDQEE